METDALVSSLELAISSLQRIGKLLQEGQTVNSTDLLSVTEPIPDIVRKLSGAGSGKAAALYPKLGSSLSAVLPADTPAADRLPALQCLLACLKEATEIASIEKTKKKASDFAREHLDHRNASIRSSCVTWLSYFPALFRSGSDGDKFSSQWRDTMLSALSSLQVSLASFSSGTLPGSLSMGPPILLPDPLDSNQLARRIDSLFSLSLSLLSRKSPILVPIPIEALVYIVALATSHLPTEQERGPVREVQCSGWRFLEKLSGLLHSCLLPLSQPISALFTQSILNLPPRYVSVAMLQSLSSWLEVSRGGVLSAHLHQFLRFLSLHSSLRIVPATEPPRAPSRHKRHRVNPESEFSTDRDVLLLANQCLSTSASLIKNCVTEVSVAEYDTFMSHLTLLLQDSSQLQTQFPSDPLIIQHSSLLHAVLSDSLLYPHPLSPPQAPVLLPHFTLGLSSPHAPTRQSCRAAVSLIEAMTHPTLPPIRPVSCYPSLPPTCPLQSPRETGDWTPPPHIDTSPVPDSTADATKVSAVNSSLLLTTERDSNPYTESHSLNGTGTDRPVASPISTPVSATAIFYEDTVSRTAPSEERTAKVARVDSTELPVVSYTEDLTSILSTFVEAGPDVD